MRCSAGLRTVRKVRTVRTVRKVRTGRMVRNVVTVRKVRTARTVRAGRMVRTVVAVIALVGLFSGCSSNDDGTLIFAASSLAAAADGIDEALASEGIDKPEWVLAGSSRLVAQVRDGARPDIIVSADATQLDEILRFGYVLVDQPAIANRLVLAVADDNPADVTGIDDLGLDGPLVGLCAPEVPCGATAARIADHFGVTLRPDTAEPNVRALAHKLANGELDAGLVYITDARSLGLQTVTDPRLADPDDCSHPAVTSYGIAVLAAGPDTAEPGPAVPADRYLLPDALRRAGFELELCA